MLINKIFKTNNQNSPSPLGARVPYSKRACVTCSKFHENKYRTAIYCHLRTTRLPSVVCSYIVGSKTHAPAYLRRSHLTELCHDHTCTRDDITLPSHSFTDSTMSE